MKAINITELKEHIIKNNKTTFILESLKCHHIKESEKQIRAAFPDGDNTTAICVYRDTLKVNQYTHGQLSGDIITLVQDILKINFLKSFYWLHKILNINFTYNNEVKTQELKYEPLNIFTKHISVYKSCSKHTKLYESEILNEYIPTLHIDWIHEGITESTRKIFDIRYGLNEKRIMIPYRSLENPEKYIGIIGRTTKESYKELGVPKYLAVKPFAKSTTVYGYTENYTSIQKSSIVTIFESEKSVLKRHSRLDGSTLAIGGHSISTEQIKLILSLNVDVVICFDKDIDIQNIRSVCEKFRLHRKTYYMFDKWSLLKSKESPADLTDKLYKFMFKYKILYDESEHLKYLKMKGCDRNAK